MSVDLRAARVNKGLSASEAAEQIGVDTAVLLRAETGASVPHPRNALKIAEFYEVKVTDIWPVVSPTGAAA